MFSRSARIYDAIYTTIRDYPGEAAQLDELIQEHRPGARTLLDVACHRGDMADFDLGRRFDAVLCMFSSIGYVRTEERLRSAAAAMVRHLAPGGVVAIEPWLTPDEWDLDHVGGVFIDQPQLKIARLSRPEREGNFSAVEFHYLVGRPREVEHFTERHELGLFTVEQHLDAFRAAGLEVEHDPEGPMGRGLYIGVAP